MTAIAKIVVPESNFKQLHMCQSLYINYAFFFLTGLRLVSMLFRSSQYNTDGNKLMGDPNETRFFFSCHFTHITSVVGDISP